MKKLNVYNILGKLGLLSLLAALAVSCEKGPEFREFSYPTYEVTGMSSSSGFPTQTVKVTGKNFGTLLQAVKLNFNGVLATKVISCTDTEIVVEIPNNATSGKVSLSIWSKTDAVGNYTVLPIPSISSVVSKGSIASVVAAVGDTVYIKGAKFITTPADVEIDFNGTKAPNITLLTDSLIKVITPAGYTAGSVSVSFKGFKVTGDPALAPVLPSGDVSSYFLKNYMYPIQTIETTTPTTSGTVRWFTPKFWTVTNNIKNHINGTTANGGTGLPSGGLDYRPFKDTTGASVFRQVFGIEAGWGATSIINGKVYQTVTLPAGNYRFVTRMRQNSFSVQPVYLCAAAASLLPDAINAGTTLAFKAITSTNHDSGANDATYHDSYIDFSLSARTDVTLGFVIADFSGNSSSGEFVRFENFKLWKL